MMIEIVQRRHCYPFFSQRVKGRLSEGVWLCVFCMLLHTFKQELCILSMDWIGVGSADTGVHHLPLISMPQWLSDQYFEAACAGVNEMYAMVSGIWIIGPQLVLLFGQALQVWPWWCLSLDVVEIWKDTHHCQFTLCCYLRLKVPALSFPAQASLPSPRCIVVIEKCLIQTLIPRDVLLLWHLAMLLLGEILWCFITTMRSIWWVNLFIFYVFIFWVSYSIIGSLESSRVKLLMQCDIVIICSQALKQVHSMFDDLQSNFTSQV